MVATLLGYTETFLPPRRKMEKRFNPFFFFLTMKTLTTKRKKNDETTAPTGKTILPMISGMWMKVVPNKIHT